MDDGDEVEVAKTSSATKQSSQPSHHSIFSFLSRRPPKNQIGVTQAALQVDAEVPHTDDLFGTPSPGTLKKSFSLQPRGPFSLCCSVDSRAMTPVIVRYNNNNNNTTSGKSSAPTRPPRRSHSNFKDNLAYESNDIDRRFYSPPPPPPVADISERPRSRKVQVQPSPESRDEAMDTLNELRSCANYSPSSFDKRPGYAEYYKQNTYNSIAMSACKSRLREKLLPPDKIQLAQEQQQQQTDIYSVTSDTEEVSSNNNNTNRLNGHATGTSSTPPTATEVHYAQRPASADSLARQALMAAQVLHLIPAERARARSIAQGGSTNVVCNNTLLGTSELNRILPNREVKIFVGTWNMNGEAPPG